MPDLLQFTSVEGHSVSVSTEPELTDTLNIFAESGGESFDLGPDDAERLGVLLIGWAAGSRSAMFGVEETE